MDGFDLHGDARASANDRARLEHLCRYLLRPLLVEDRLRIRADGRVAIRLKRAWRDGTTHLVLEPLELLAKLAALTPRPEVNLLLYHGLLAPHARGRPGVVRYGRPASAATAAAPPEPEPAPRRNWPWAALMHRAFALDVLACPRCGGPAARRSRPARPGHRAPRQPLTCPDAAAAALRGASPEGGPQPTRSPPSLVPDLPPRLPRRRTPRP